MSQIIQKYLEHRNINFEVLKENSNAVHFEVQLPSGNFYHCILDDLVTEKIIVCYCIATISVPKEKHNDMAILLTFLNYGLLLGNFEMDINDGEVRCKTNLYYGHIQLNKVILDDIFSTNLAIMDEYFPLISKLINENISVSKIISTVR